MPTSRRQRRYSRKKFWDWLFRRRSPRNAAVFGFSWMMLGLALPPGLVLLFVPPLLLHPGKPNMANIASLLSLLLLPLLAYLYGLLTLGFAYVGLVRKFFSADAAFRGAAALCAFFFPAGVLIVAPLLWKQKRFAAMSAAILGSLPLLLFLFCGDLVLALPPLLFAQLQLAGVLLFLFALFRIHDGRRFRTMTLLPALLLISYAAGMQIYDMALSRETARLSRELTELTGRATMPEAFWKQEEQGYPLSSAPLAKLIETKPNNPPLELPTLPPTGDFQRQLQAYRQANPAFVDAVAEFLKLPPQPIRHDRPESGHVASILLPELSALREAARLTAAKLIISAGDRQAVLQANAEQIRLRDWCAANMSLISRLVAIWIENTRLQSLAFALAADSLTDADFQILADDHVTWGTILAEGFADESVRFPDTIQTLKDPSEPLLSSDDLLLSSILPRFVPLEADIWLKQDWRFALNSYLASCRLFRNPDSAVTGMERSRHLKNHNREVRENFYRLSDMLLPALQAMQRKQAAIQDRKLLADTAFQVERFRRKYGKLPETLEVLVPEFLPAVPLDSMNRLPIRYEHGELQFQQQGKPEETHRAYRLYTCESDGGDVGGTKAQNTFAVLFSQVDR